MCKVPIHNFTGMKEYKKCKEYKYNKTIWVYGWSCYAAWPGIMEGMRSFIHGGQECVQHLNISPTLSWCWPGQSLPSWLIRLHFDIPAPALNHVENLTRQHSLIKHAKIIIMNSKKYSRLWLDFLALFFVALILLVHSSLFSRSPRYLYDYWTSAPRILINRTLFFLKNVPQITSISLVFPTLTCRWSSPHSPLLVGLYMAGYCLWHAVPKANRQLCGLPVR